MYIGRIEKVRKKYCSWCGGVDIEYFNFEFENFHVLLLIITPLCQSSAQIDPENYPEQK